MWNEHLYSFSLTCILIGLVCFAVWVNKNSKLSSSTISFIVWVIANIILALVEHFVFSITGDVSIDRYIWYCSLSSVHLLSLFLIAKLHEIEGIKINRDGAIICLGFVALALVQISRLADKEIFRTFAMNNIYKPSIVTINIIVWSYIIVITYFRKSIELNKRGQI